MLSIHLFQLATILATVHKSTPPSKQWHMSIAKRTRVAVGAILIKSGVMIPSLAVQQHGRKRGTTGMLSQILMKPDTADSAHWPCGIDMLRSLAGQG